MDFEAEIEDFAEVGMCGTAAVVVRVESITRAEKTFTFDRFETIANLRSTLTGIQCGEVEDTLGFMEDVCAVDDALTPSFVPAMTTAEETGLIRQLNRVDLSDSFHPDLHGREQHLLEYHLRQINIEIVVFAKILK
eukprot:COSAG05_NODE_1475_length_4782_cov_16.988682_2_plen_136_part_00